ncbi:Auxin-responsive protein SAUR32-like protein [Drosera capensis]
MKLKKGYLVVQVGLEADENQDDDAMIKKFVIPISYLHHPLFLKLLDQARETYGYHVEGPLRLPCSADDFVDLRWRIEKEYNCRLQHDYNGDRRSE